MTTQTDANTSGPVNLTDDDVAYLLSVLRDPNRPQPVTTQQMIDALRARGNS